MNRFSKTRVHHCIIVEKSKFSKEEAQYLTVRKNSSYVYLPVGQSGLKSEKIKKDYTSGDSQVPGTAYFRLKVNICLVFGNPFIVCFSKEVYPQISNLIPEVINSVLQR